MKRLLSALIVAVAATACAFALAACGSSGGGSSQTIDMGDYTYEVPADWGEIQQTYPDMEMYWVGGDEDHPKLTTDRFSLELAEDETAAEAVQECLDKWFNDSDTTKHVDIVDFTVGELPARASVVDYGDGTANYMILFSPDAIDLVDMIIMLDSPDDADGIATSEAIRDSIALPEL